MTAYRTSIGPVDLALGPRAEVLEFATDGTMISARGDSVAEAFATLEADPGSAAHWCGAARLRAQIGQGQEQDGQEQDGQEQDGQGQDWQGQDGTPNAAQYAALMRHLWQLSDPTAAYTLENAQSVRAMMSTFSTLSLRGPGLAPGTSLPFEFESSGVFGMQGCVVFSAAEDAVTGVVLPDPGATRALYEAGFDPAQAGSSGNFGGFTLMQSPTWAADVVAELTGQRFVPSLFLQIDGGAIPADDMLARMCTILAACWPDPARAGQEHSATYHLTDGVGEITLRPLLL